MTVIYKEPGKDPHRLFIPNSLKTLQTLVGGYIEAHRFTEDTVLLCNEDGRRLGLEPNCYGTSGGDFFVGPVIICGVDEEEFTDIPKDKIEVIMKMLRHGRE